VIATTPVGTTGATSRPSRATVPPPSCSRRRLERWEAWTELRDLLDEQVRMVESSAERADLLRRSARISEETCRRGARRWIRLRAVSGNRSRRRAGVRITGTSFLAAGETLGGSARPLGVDVGTGPQKSPPGTPSPWSCRGWNARTWVMRRSPSTTTAKCWGAPRAIPNAIAALEGMLGDLEQRVAGGGYSSF